MAEEILVACQNGRVYNLPDMTVETSQKINGWDDRLKDLITDKALTPFQWGIQDCVTFMSEAVFLMTGVDVTRWCRGKYNDQETAKQLLWGHRGMGLEKTFASIFQDNGFIRTDRMEPGNIGFIQAKQQHEGSMIFENTTMTLYLSRGRVIAPGLDGLQVIHPKDYALSQSWEL